MNINGKWKGTVIYGKEYREHMNSELYFEVEITQNNELFTGIAIDTGGVGTSPDKANLNGRFDGKEISFVKQYESYHYSNRKWETIIDKTRSGPEIKYTGSYNEKEQCFCGDWIIRSTAKLLGFILIKYKNTGTWVMKRS